MITWQESHKLCLWIYSATKTFPSNERFRLIDQMCRAASSVPANLAEGSIKPSMKERARFYSIAHTSLEELHYYCLLARDLGYFTNEQFSKTDDHIQRISYLLHRLRSACFTSSTSHTNK